MLAEGGGLNLFRTSQADWTNICEGSVGRNKQFFGPAGLSLPTSTLNLLKGCL